jgi:hypothetical protein
MGKLSKSTIIKAIVKEDEESGKDSDIDRLMELERPELIEIYNNYFFTEEVKLRPSKDKKFMGHTPNKRKTSRYA